MNASRPPSDQCIIECPHCGGSQAEPRLVLTTDCIHCGAHIHSPRAQPKRSLLPWKNQNRRQAESKDGLRSDFARVEQLAVSGGRAAPEPEPTRRTRRQRSRDITCPFCLTHRKLPEITKSIMCPNCSEALDLEDFLIEDCANFQIRTVGDVVIEETGVLQSTEIFCSNLTVNGGKIMGKIHCSGDFRFTGSTTILGSITCRHFFLDEGSYLATVQPILCQTAEVLGECEASVDAEGKVSIGGQGTLRGDCLAGGLAIAPGGRLQGASRTRD